MQTSSIKSSSFSRDRIGRTPRFEYVNRKGQIVNPKTGKPYDLKNGSSSFDSKKNKRLPVKTQGAIFGGLKKIPTDPTRDPPPRACYNCWQKGHARRECTRPIVGRYCNNCGRRGEDLKSCPRCMLAHERYLRHIEAKERGEELDPEEVARLMCETDEEYEDENGDGCDEVLRELMLRDERARNNGRASDYKREDLARYEEREGSDGYRKRDWERERDAYDDRYASDRRTDYSRKETSRYDDSADMRYEMESREMRKEEPEEREHERWRVHEKSSAKQSDSYGAEITADPVQDFLVLAKSIAHLSPETQDMIMQQVISERKEKQAKLKVTAHEERVDDVWP